MRYNPEIHKKRSIRLKNYDYSQAGLYFITICAHKRESQQNQFQNMIPRSIVKGNKIGVIKWLRGAREKNFTPQRMVWQRNYYEHIIRNQHSYQTISQYIIDNPARWQDDKFYNEGLCWGQNILYPLNG